MSDFIQKLFTTRQNYSNGDSRVGERERIWYDSVTNTFRISDGETPGGLIIGGGSGGGSYTLPTASPTVKGGVKIGANITITNGVISVAAPFSGNYNDLSNKPTLFSGSYTDLTNKPTIPQLPSNATGYLYNDGSGTLTWSTVSGGGGASVTEGATPPNSPNAGDLWWDTVSGNLFIYYDSNWVAAMSVTAQVNADWNAISGLARILNKPTIPSLGNLSVVGTNLQTVQGSVTNADIVLAPNGTGSVSVPSLKIPVGSVISGNSSIIANIANLTLASVVAHSSTTALTTGQYGITNGIPAPWTVYSFTTTPSPILQVGDVISGAGIPVLSNVIFVGSGSYQTYVIVDTDFGDNPTPAAGTIVYTARSIVNAGLSIVTATNTDITLNPGSGGNIVPHSDIIPYTTNEWSLGTPGKRFKELWLGTGTIFIEDETLGTDTAIGAKDGLIYLQGGVGLRVGEFTFIDNQIKIADNSRDIIIGTTAATGNLILNRPLEVNSPSGNITFRVDRQGLTTINAPGSITSTQSALTITGNTSAFVRERNFPDTLLMLSGKDGSSARMNLDSFGTNSYNVIAGRQANGTAQSPTNTRNDDTLLRFSSQGWGTTGYVSTIGRINIQATQDFTDSAGGTRIRFQTTPNDSIVIQNVTADITSAGLSFVGNSTGGITFRDGTRQITAAKSVTESATAPNSPSAGDMWWDTVSGNLFIYYDGSWVSAVNVTTPVNADWNATSGLAQILNKPAPYSLPTASTSIKGGVKIDGTTITITNGVISVGSSVTNSRQFKGVWNANTNSPTLSSNQVGAEAGWQYIVETTGTRDLGNGTVTYNVGDIVIYDGTNWYDIPGTASTVSSFNSRTGIVTLESNDVTTALGYTPSAQIKHTFSYGDLPSSPIGSVPAGAIIKEVCIILLTAFDATSTLSVGTSIHPVELMDTTDITTRATGTYTTEPAYKYTTNTDLVLSITAGASTQGNGIVIVYYE